MPLMKGWNMNTRRFWMVVIVCGLLIPFAAATVDAAPLCGPYQPQPNTTDPNNDPAFCQAAFQNNDIVWASASVPYAWLRDRPISNVIVATIYPKSEQFYVDRLYTDAGLANPIWDGAQWWYYIHDTQNPAVYGWIEQASLEIVNASQSLSLPVPLVLYFPDATTPNSWLLPARAKPASGLPFILVRQFPASDSATSVTVFPQQSFTVLAIPAPAWDGAQWWWSVEFTSGYQTYRGWVEQWSIAAY